MIQNRREAYLKKVSNQSLSLFFSGHSALKSADQHYPFTVNRNFFYLTGIDIENAALLLAKGADRNDAYLFIEKVDPVKALWDGAGLSFEDASQIASIDLKNIKPISELDGFIAQLLTTSRRAIYGTIESIYFDLERLNHLAMDTYPIQYSKSLLQLYPFITIKTNQMLMAELRMSKDAIEIDAIQKAIAITEKGLNRIMAHLSVHEHEHQIEAEFNYALNLNQSIPAFNTIIASGKNATVLHYVQNNAPLNKEGLLLCDLGASYGNYHADITRTYPVSGRFTERERAIYSVVLEANKKTIEALKPGMTHKEFNDCAKAILIDGAKKLGLIEQDDEIQKYYYHGVGHYLGLDVHDVGNYSLPIPEGAVITVEPGLYIAEEGIGIRIEDDVLVTQEGPVNLSSSIIKEIDEIEAFLQKSKTP